MDYARPSDGVFSFAARKRTSRAKTERGGATVRLRYSLIPLGVTAALVVALTSGASAASNKAGTESFTSTQNINVPGGTVVASGVINDVGQDTVLSATEDIFSFGVNGQITVLHSPRHDTQHFNMNKCTFRITEHGTYTFGNGTGEWAGYSGSGKYSVTGSATDACTGPGVGTLTISASGPINLSTQG
jgi:hypothetical protein